MNITIIGSIFGSSGYDSHTRNLANALNKICEVKLVTQLFPGWQRFCNDAELEMIKREDKGEVNIIITHPMMWKVNLTAKHNLVYCVWEGDKVPISFIKEMLNPEIEKILVPSEHTKKAIINTMRGNQINSFFYFTKEGMENAASIIDDKLVIIPHGCDKTLFYPTNEINDKFTFLMNKGWRNNEDRGGVQYGIKSFIEEFSSLDKVRLIVKINPAYGIPDINKLVQEISPKSLNRKDLPEVIFDVGNYEYNKLVNLYNKSDVFVSPTRAESFNIPCIEAMSCGKPVITTNFGGQTDFVNESNGWIINGELTEVKNELMYEGIRWLTPNIEELRKTMRHCYENQSEVKIKGNRAKEDSEALSWDNSANLIKNLI